MHHKGMSMVELLGAIVILGIILSLSAMMISVITRANDRIIEKSQANTQGMLLTNYIDNQLNEFGPTNYLSCTSGSSCISFVKAYEYIVNNTNQTLELITYNPVLTFDIYLLDQNLYINDESYLIENYTLHNDSNIAYSVEGNILSYTITIVLVGRYDRYVFNYQKSLTLSTTPS